MFSLLLSSLTGTLLILAQMPSSSTYKIDSYGIGTGGTAGSSSSNYSIQGISGEQSAGQITSPTYKINPGYVYTEQADVPPAPIFTNDANWYNKLHFIINPSDNPSDAKFALAISDDNFVTTRYVQNDNTVGSTLGLEDYQTYAQWGSGTGEDVIGLSPSTTYKLKAKATDGDYTESGYGPAATASTVGPLLSFSINTDSQPSPPFSINFPSLTAGSISTSSDKINVSFATNAKNGGKVYIYDANSGLLSPSRSYTIASATADLSSALEGYGAISVSAGQSSGGPFSAQSPYNGSSENVGILNTLIRPIYSSANPVVGGAGSFRLKAKPKTTTPQATDYADILTLIAAGEF